MRFGRIQSRGFGSHHPIDIDFDAIPGLLIAVVGPNGSGKTMFLETLAALTDRTCPTRGSLSELAALTGDRDAYLRATVTNGKMWTIEHRVDGVTGKGEAMVWDSEGTEVLADRKLRTFDEFATKTFPSAQVRLASTFSKQKAKGFLEISPSERKSVIQEALGIDHYEAMATQAREHARDAKERLSVASGRYYDERERIGATGNVSIDAIVDTASKAAHEAEGRVVLARIASEGATDQVIAARGEAERIARENAEAERIIGEIASARSAESTTNARLADERQRARDVGECERALDKAIDHRTSREGKALAAADTLATVRKDAEIALAANAERDRRLSARREASMAIEDARRRLNAAASSLAGAQELLSSAGEVRAAVSRSEAIATEMSELREQIAALPIQAAMDSVARAMMDAATIVEARPGVERRLRDERTRAEEYAALVAETERLGEAEQACAAAQEVVHALQTRLEGLVGRQTDGTGRRIRDLRTGLKTIAKEPSHAVRLATIVLSADDEAEKEAGQVPTEIDAATRQLRTFTEELEVRRKDVAVLHVLKSKAQALGGSIDRSSELESELARMAEAEQTARSRLDEATAERERLKAEKASFIERVLSLRAELTSIEPLRSMARSIDTAEAQVEAHHATVTREQAALDDASLRLRVLEETSIPDAQPVPSVDAAVDALRAMDRLVSEAEAGVTLLLKDLERAHEDARRLAALEVDAEQARDRLQTLQETPVPERKPLPDLLGLEASAKEVVELLNEARLARALAEKAEAAVREAAVRIESLTVERSQAEEELADWTRIAADLGKDGLQAMEVDAIGPELSEIANDLLHTCHGSRWTVSIETQRSSADGKRTIEGCEVRVFDSSKGRDVPGDKLSGGEMVIVGEAISLALSMIACRYWGCENPTLIRDESGAALDSEGAAAYIAMLRRAARFTGASKVLFVSHARELQDLADARIDVQDGRVSVAA